MVLCYHEMLEIWTPSPPCSNLFSFGSPLLLFERSELKFNTPSPAVAPVPQVHPSTNDINYYGWFANFASNINQI